MLGLDFGNMYSKMALGFSRDSKCQISRVPFNGTFNDPDHPEGNTDYEFIAAAALREAGDASQMLEGRQALDCDMSIPLKTALIYLALSSTRNHRREVVLKMPSGPYLLRAFQEKRVTKEMMSDVLHRHFERLQRMALIQARNNGVQITSIVVTYPNYLCAYEGSKDFDKYMDWLLRILRSIWGDSTKFRVMSEGQAAALYICEPFFDAVTGSIRPQVETLFEGLNKKEWINLIVVDSGSSSLVCSRASYGLVVLT